MLDTSIQKVQNHSKYIYKLKINTFISHKYEQNVTNNTVRGAIWES